MIAKPVEQTFIDLADVIKPENHYDKALHSLKRGVRRFFSDVTDESGRPFKEEDVFSEAHVDMMMSMPWAAGVDLFYVILDHKPSPEEKAERERKGRVSQDVELLLECLYKAARCRIPFSCRIGVALTYVELKLRKDVTPVWEGFKKQFEEACQVA
jgi:hypothetical protein